MIAARRHEDLIAINRRKWPERDPTPLEDARDEVAHCELMLEAAHEKAERAQDALERARADLAKLTPSPRLRSSKGPPVNVSRN